MANTMLVAVTIIWGGGFIATSTALSAFSPFTILMIRFLGASVLPLLISWRKWRALTKAEIGHGLLVGAFLFLAFALQTFGLQSTTASKNAFLTATNVVFVPYLLWLFMKRKPKTKEWLASVICIMGIALLTLQNDALYLTKGDGLSFVCAIFFAAHIIALERYSRGMDVFVMTGLQLLTAGGISAVFALCFETWPQDISASAMTALMYSIFVATMLAYLMQTWAQKYTTANSAALILSMEALWASVFSFLFFHETMSLSMIIGACMIFFSVIFIEYQPKANPKQPHKR